MTLGANLYQPRHRTQYDGGIFANQNCVATSLATAADQMTHGRIDKTGSQVRALVKVSEETNPTTPGWSLTDVRLAAQRLGIELTPANSTWTVLVALRGQGRGILLNGDSDVFTNGCSGAFDGDHMMYLPPLDHSDGRWRKDDPICPTWAWEDPAVIRAYAGKFAGTGRASYAYTAPVVPNPPETSTEPSMIEQIPPGVKVGTLVVNGPGHSYLKLSDGTLHAVGAGFEKTEAVGPVVIRKGTILGDTLIRRTGFITGLDAAFFLATDVTFSSVVDCTDAVNTELGKAVDHIRGAVAGVLTALNEVEPR